MAVDLGFAGYFGPLLAFLIVFMMVFAVLARTKLLGEKTNPWVLLFVSFLVATIFVSAAGLRDYVLTVTPWFAVLVVSLFFILFLVAFVGKPAEFMQKGIGVGFVVVMVLIFLFSGFIIFSDSILPYLPGGNAYENPQTAIIADEIFNSRVMGAILLLGVSALVSWVLVKAGKEKKD